VLLTEILHEHLLAAPELFVFKTVAIRVGPEAEVQPRSLNCRLPGWCIAVYNSPSLSSYLLVMRVGNRPLQIVESAFVTSEPGVVGSESRTSLTDKPQ
jgi:hypothetical protein